MNKLVILCTTLLSALSAAESINVASIEYGARSTSINIIDSNRETSENTKKFAVNFAAVTKVDKIELNIKPSNGKLVFKTTVDKDTVVIKEIEVNDKTDQISFALDMQINGVIVEWVPENKDSLLEVRDFGAYTSDQKTVTFYKDEVRTYVQKYMPIEAHVIQGFPEQTSSTFGNISQSVAYQYLPLPTATPVSR